MSRNDPDTAAHARRLFRAARPVSKGNPMLGTILLVVLVLMLIGGLPVFPYSRKWGYAPGGVIGVILVIVLILVLTGRL